MHIPKCGGDRQRRGSGLGGRRRRRWPQRARKSQCLDVTQPRRKDGGAALGGAGFQMRRLRSLASAEARRCGGASPRTARANSRHIAPRRYGEARRRRDGAQPLADFRASIDINLVGAFNLTPGVSRRRPARPARGGPARRRWNGRERGLLGPCHRLSRRPTKARLGQPLFRLKGASSPCRCRSRASSRSSNRVNRSRRASSSPRLLLGAAEAQESSALGAEPGRLGDPREYAALVCISAQNGYSTAKPSGLAGALRMAPR